MSPGETTPGILQTEYASRRAALASLLPANSLALFPATPAAYMGHDVPYSPHHQDTDLFYLCGLQEQTSLLACAKPSADSASVRWHLFVRPSSKTEELWDGARAGVDGAQSFFLPEGAAHALDQAPNVLMSELRDGGLGQLFYDASANRDIDARLRPTLLGAAKLTGQAQPPRRLVHALRLRKSAAEIQLMRKAGDVGALAMNATMAGSLRASAAGMTEHVLAAQFEFESKFAGAERLAYPCVVAGGANAVTLHYMHNNAPLRHGEMVLMDAGASVHGYCSDITRTWPLSGRYSAAQKDLYEAVLDVNERIIAAVTSERQRGSQPGVSINALHRQSQRWTYENLVDLGIIRHDDPHAGEKFRTYYPHAIGHWLGLDVHDTPSVDSGTPLEGGMVITVEPGLYIPADDERVSPHFRGLGVRIEDDVLIAADSSAPAEVLTRAVPKTVAEVETWLAAAAAESLERPAAEEVA